MSVSSRLNAPAHHLSRGEEDHRPYPGRHRRQEPAEARVPSEHARPLPHLTGEEPTRIVTAPPVPSDRLPARAPQAALRAEIDTPPRKQRNGLLGAVLRALPRGAR
jgi:hypothetical protein